MAETKNLGDILAAFIIPELSDCSCGRQPRVTQREEGLVSPWRAECECGFMTTVAYSKMHAVVKWEKVTRQRKGM